MGRYPALCSDHPLVGCRARALLGGISADRFFDANKVHLHSTVFRACARGRLWPVVIAAATTWLLQPLDTHAFVLYKCRLCKAHQRSRIQSASGAVRVGMLLAAIYTAIRDVLETRDWASSFERDGCGAAQVGVSARVLEHVGYTVPLAVPCTRPTLEQLRQCWPRRQRVPLADV